MTLSISGKTRKIVSIAASLFVAAGWFFLKDAIEQKLLEEHDEDLVSRSSKILKLSEMVFDTAELLSKINGKKQFVSTQEDVSDLKWLSQMALSDKTGTILWSSLPLKPGVSIADREHFRVHSENKIKEVFISKPVLGRVSNKWTIQVSTAKRENNDFSGVSVVSVSSEELGKSWEMQSSKYTAVLVGDDGVVRASSSFEGIGQKTILSEYLSSRSPQVFSFREKSSNEMLRVSMLPSVEHKMIVFVYEKVPEDVQTFGVLLLLPAVSLIMLFLFLGFMPCRCKDCS